MAKFIKRNEDDVVVYAFEDSAVLTAIPSDPEVGISGERILVERPNKSNHYLGGSNIVSGHTIVEGKTLPDYFQVNRWSWWDDGTENGRWTRIPTNENQKVTMAQARKSLLRSGITPAQVEAAINANPDADAAAEALIEWEYALHVERQSPLVQGMALALGLSETDLDVLFDRAETL